MRGVSKWRVAPLLVACFLCWTAAAWGADDPPTNGDPLQARLGPPGGVTSQARVSPPVGITPSPDARAHPPVGATARMNPPVGAPLPPLSPLDLMRLWLQARIGVPIG